MSSSASSSSSSLKEEDLTKDYTHVAQALEQLETSLRIKHIPSLTKRARYMEVEDLEVVQNHLNKKSQRSAATTNDDDDDDDNDVAEITTTKEQQQQQVVATISTDGHSASLRRQNLRTFSLSMLTTTKLPSLSNLTSLNVSKNELMDIPGLSSLPNLKTLNLERNWFNTLPLEIGKLVNLEILIAARNFLRPNASSLLFPQLQTLKKLKELDLLYNQKCGRQHHRTLIQNEIPQLKSLKLTLWEEVGNVSGSYVGASAAERDALLLRSQLEPWGTVNLRRRLVQDFGQEPTDAALVDRAGVMERLLDCYAKEGMMMIDEENGYGRAKRMKVYVEGTKVCENLVKELMVELKAWTEETGKIAKNRERPSIRAKNYMILRSPKPEDDANSTTVSTTTAAAAISTRASRRAKRKQKKLSKYQKIYSLALTALQNVDPAFAARCTEIAVTYGFTGSPHIDKQNCGPFYGLALGNFKSGQGGICVECSARVVAVVDTKGKLGRVDGRYPHWVDEYEEKDGEEKEEELERYSLIYYETGNKFVKPGPAIFTIPKERS